MTDPFNCIGCKASLYGCRYIQVNGEQHCIPCYDRVFAKTCAKCKQLIGHNSTELVCEDRHYHERCARCFHCNASLVDRAFISQGEALLCSDCHCRQFTSQCQACNLPITPGMRRLEFGQGAWHDACFVCHSCGQPIGSQGFVPHEDRWYCAPCYDRQLSQRCGHCNEVLTDGGVIYQGDLWHSECLVCTACHSPLADKSFTSHEDWPYCFSCFSSRYGNKCAACSKPITGQEGMRYISFEDRQWHRSCFNCSRCATSLVGVGFYGTRDLILCHDCKTNSTTARAPLCKLLLRQ